MRKMSEKFYDFDPADMLDSNEAMVTGDVKFVASALGVVAMQ